MTAESASDRHSQWEIVVRRSFGIPDTIDAEEARSMLVASFEEQLHENGWHSATHAIANPMADALLAFGASDDLGDGFFIAEGRSSGEVVTTRDSAHRLIDRGMTVVDPEHLVLDTNGEHPPEIVAAVEVSLERVFRYAREQPLSE